MPDDSPKILHEKFRKSKISSNAFDVHWIIVSFPAKYHQHKCPQERHSALQGTSLLLADVMENGIA